MVWPCIMDWPEYGQIPWDYKLKGIRPLVRPRKRWFDYAGYYIELVTTLKPEKEKMINYYGL